MIAPLILSGGAGTRLWPMSRQTYPKPFMPLADGETLFAGTVRRALALPGVDELTVITNDSLRFLTADALTRILPPRQARLLLEPVARNTAAAIALAALDLSERLGSETLMLVLPADHLVTGSDGFAAAVASAAVAAAEDWLVTFGLQPQRPETGFGYIEASAEAVGGGSARRVERFVEKPDLATAESYVRSGRFFWNAGMFCFKAGMILAEFERHAPELLAAAVRAHELAAEGSLGGIDLREYAARDFEPMADISIDYAIMEPSDRVAVVPAQFGWSDIGSWPAFAESSAADEGGNVLVGDVIAIDTANTLVHSSDRLTATVGVHDLMIVDTADALLVAHRDSAQDVRAVVDELRRRGHESYRVHRTVHRPWGTYTVLEEGDRFKIKRIVVKPGARLSLQMHHHRSEHWVVVSGMARVTNGERSLLLSANESTFIPAGHPHRLENPGLIELVMIEVQSGDYLGEDDIVRFDDHYGRCDAGQTEGDEGPV